MNNSEIIDTNTKSTHTILIRKLKNNMLGLLKQLKLDIKENNWVNFDRTMAYLQWDRGEVAIRQIAEEMVNE